MADAEEEREPDPRFVFANERTFLAWIRTSLALLAGGVAATQLIPDFEVAGARHVLGVPLLALGGVSALVAHWQWARSERALRRGAPLPPSPMLRLVSIAVAAVAIVAVVLALFETES